MECKYKVSVAMALYNGERFLSEQLESILNQTYPISELVACDDGSSDNTRVVFENFVKNKQANKYQYIRNNQNLGYSKNFLHAASLCSGDIIMFSDQDDIWVKEKIEKMVSIFEEYPDAEAVVCAYEPFYDSGKTERSLVEYLKKILYKKGGVQRVPFYIQVQTMLSGGLTLAVRKETLSEISEYIDRFKLTYDIPIGLICAYRNSLYRTSEVLVKHRLHCSNAGSPNLSFISRLKDLNRHIKGREVELLHLKCIYDLLKDNLSTSDADLVADEIMHREYSIKQMKEGKCGYLFKSIFRKNKYSNTIISISNLLCCFVSKLK